MGCSPFACAAIAELLCNPGELRKLHLFNNMSDDAGAQAIAALVARAPKIADFKMVSSRIKEAGGQVLAQVLAGKPLPPPSARLVQAWEDAKREAIKSEYAFKPGLNYYKKGSPAS